MPGSKLYEESRIWQRDVPDELTNCKRYCLNILPWREFGRRDPERASISET